MKSFLAVSWLAAMSSWVFGPLWCNSKRDSGRPPRLGPDCRLQRRRQALGIR